MANDRRRIVITRLMQVAIVLHEAKRGLTVRQLMARLERSKSTVHRDILSLRQAGVGIETETVGGEARYSLSSWPVAAVAPTPLQLAALCLARDAVENFEGTAAVEQLDQLLAQWGKLPKVQLSLTFQRRKQGQGSLVGTLDGAIVKQRRLKLEYRGERDSQSKSRKVEPIALRASGEQLYLFAYDVDRKDYRQFKTARMGKIMMLEEPSADHSHVNLEGKFAHAIKTWTAPAPTPVVVRIAAEKARFVTEYPIVADQQVKAMPDGSVEVAANVNGITEALNWVLSWGAHAEAVSPPELRAQAAAEVRGAAARYGEVDPDRLSVRRGNGAERTEGSTGNMASGAAGTVRKVNVKGRTARDVANTTNADRDQDVSRELGRRGSRVGG